MCGRCRTSILGTLLKPFKCALPHNLPRVGNIEKSSTTSGTSTVAGTDCAEEFHMNVTVSVLRVGRPRTSNMFVKTKEIHAWHKQSGQHMCGDRCIVNDIKRL